MPEINVDGLLEQIAAADTAFADAIAGAQGDATVALDSYLEAERRHLGDRAGRYGQQADEAWTALATAREALARARAAAEAVRQQAITAAVNASGSD